LEIKKNTVYGKRQQNTLQDKCGKVMEGSRQKIVDKNECLLKVLKCIKEEI